MQNQINENKPLTVQQYTGIVESRAVNLIIDDGFEPKVQRLPNGDQPVGIVFEQSPIEGTSLARGGIVTIKVSTGKKTVDVPDVVGKQLTDAVATLTRAGLIAKSVGVPSDKPSGTVTAQDPRSGTSLVEGATVRINYSTGPKQVAVPPVVGLDYSTALQQLQAAGFAVARTDVESDAAGRGRHVPGAERLVDGHEGLHRQPLRLERAADDAAAGRHGPDRGGREGDAEGRRVQGERDAAGHRRRDVRRRRHLAGSGRGTASRIRTRS